MTVIDFEEYKSHLSRGLAREICFHGSQYSDQNDQCKTLNICVKVENGDVAGILQTVQDNGGIAETDDSGVIYFLPWPCAAVEIRDL